MKINEFPEIAEITDNDFLLVWDAETQTTRRIKAVTFKSYIDSSSGGDIQTFTYQSNGDANGLLYWLGLINGSFNNPQTLGKIIVTASSVGSPGGVSVLTNRLADEFYTNAQANSWVQLRLIDGQLKLKSYSLRNRFRSDGDFQYSLRNWKFQGSNDAASWTDLDTQINNTTINGTGVWVTVILAEMSEPYSYFRLLQNGETSNNNGIFYLCLGEVELYGEYVY